MLLQYLMVKSFATDTDAQKKFTSFSGKEASSIRMQEVYDIINRSINPFSMELKKVIYDGDGLCYWSLVNTNYQDDISKSASSLDASQLELFRQLLDEIVKAGGSYSTKGLKKIHDKLPDAVKKKLVPKVLRSTLRLLAKEGWISSIGSGETEKLVVGVRAVSDLSHYFANADLPQCTVCDRRCLIGFTCADSCGDEDSDCKVRVHMHCWHNYTNTRKTIVCPDRTKVCKLEWTKVPKA